MKKIVGIFILGFGLILNLLSQTSFEISVDTEDDSIVWEAVHDTNGNAILVGDIGTFGNDYDAYILKVFPDGNYIEKRFDRQDTVSFFSTIEILDNGNYFITGSYSPTNNYYEKNYFWVVIVDADLNLISERSYKIRDGYFDIRGTSQSIIDYQGNIIVATTPKHYAKDGKNSFSDLGFYKFTPEGDTLLSKYYCFMFNDLPFEFKQLPFSNDILLIGRTDFSSLIFIDTDLNILKDNHFNGPGLGACDLSSDFWLTDTSFLVVGENYYNNGGNYDDYIKVVAMDTSATVFQELDLNKVDTIDYPAWKKSMAYANDTTIYVSGYTGIVEFWTTDPTIIELWVIDKYMNVLGYKDLGGDAYYEPWGLISMEDDGCLIYGISYTNPEVAERDVHIWKVLREDIELLVSVKDSPTQEKDIKVFPNPVEDRLTIDLGKNLSWDKMQLSIKSIEGKTVFQKKITENGNLLEAELSNLQSGVYILKVSKGNRIIYSEKIIK